MTYPSARADGVPGVLHQQGHESGDRASNVAMTLRRRSVPQLGVDRDPRLLDSPPKVRVTTPGTKPELQ
eukprot:8749369-Pyramimonas_sp.AAC.1